MAEIRLQHKQRRAWWPWLLLILVALLAYLFWSRGHQGTAAGSTVSTVGTDSTTSPSANGAAATGAADSTSGTRSSSDAVADFRTFVAQQSAPADEDAAHQYTADGLRRLALAIEKVNPSGSSTQVATVRAEADSLQQTSTGNDRHADMAQTAFRSAADAMATGAGASSAASLRRAADAIKPKQHLLAQKTQIQSFFQAASRALDGTSSASGAR